MIPLLLATALATSGFRGDGTGTAEVGPTQPVIAWSTPLAGWSNASPVAFGELICTSVEPTGLTCVDGATGAERWSATHPAVDALPPAERAAATAAMRSAEAAAARLDAVRRQTALLARQMRSADRAPDTAAKLATATTTLNELREAVEAGAAWRTPADKDIIGWSSPTPVADADGIFVLYGHGVVARHDQAGALIWARWLGPPDTPMRGYDLGISASPVRVAGLVVVPYNQLYGLDAATGETRWIAGEWRHYGSPAVATVDGVPWLVTPDGRVLSTAGATVADGLGELLYVGPHADGDRVWFIGESFDHVSHATEVLLGGDPLQATVRWRRQLEIPRLYTGPVLSGTSLHLFTEHGEHRALSTADGRELPAASIAALVQPGRVMASPVAAGGRVWVGGDKGVVVELTESVDPRVVITGDGMRASPLLLRGDLVVRTFEGLVRYTSGGP